MRTVTVSNSVKEIWDGAVLIDEIREFHDDRGYLAEVWRTDDETMVQSEEDQPKMCYVSQTKPYVMRGPHQHRDQTDWFFTFHSRMSYHFYNPDTDEMVTYFTDPTKITRVKVAPPIVHSYRNLEGHPVFTSNYPTSWFMGWEKKETVDEIRWESKVSSNQTFIVIGAGGRLGSAIVKELYDTMGRHKHHVIPVYDKLTDPDRTHDVFTNLDSALTNFENGKIESEKITVINCAAYANVQKANGAESDSELSARIKWANTDMPLLICKMSAARGWKLIQFSTDYVYQKLKAEASIYAELGHYTRSKIEMEHQFDIAPDSLVKGLTTIRVANLYDMNDDEGKHNVIKKFAKVNQNKKKFTIDPHIKIYPTEVNELARYLVKNMANREDNAFSKLLWNSNEYKKCNLIPSHSYTLAEFIAKYFGAHDFKIYENDVEPWCDSFEGNINNGSENVFVFESDEALIYLALEKLKENNYVGRTITTST